MPIPIGFNSYMYKYTKHNANFVFFVSLWEIHILYLCNL